MKTILVCMALFLMCVSSAHARSDFGLGIAVGNPLGISGKYWLDARHAVDGVFALPGKNEVYLHGDYLWHDFGAFPRPEEGKLPLYYGAGCVVSSEKFGLRGVIGVEYIFDGYPFDLFLELAPVLGLGPDVGLSFAGGLGGRYYFDTGTRGRR